MKPRIVYRPADGLLPDQQAQLVSCKPVSPPVAYTIPYTELPDPSPGPLAAEWNTYREIVGRLLGEGHEGKWVQIRGEQLLGMWDSESEAYAAYCAHYDGRPVLIKEVLALEPVIRVRHNIPWAS